MIFAVNDALEKKLLEGGELKAQLEAELQDKLKKMEKEFENSVVKAAGKHCCKTRNRFRSLKHVQLCGIQNIGLLDTLTHLDMLFVNWY